MRRRLAGWAGMSVALIGLAGCGRPFPAGQAEQSGGKPELVAAKPVKRYILMIADGCGDGQREAHSLCRHGRRNAAVWDSFPVQLAMGTPSSEGRPYDSERAWADGEWVLEGYTDSAAAATAMSTGRKTYNKALGVDDYAQPLPHFMAEAEARGRATGVVSSVQWSHATPAGFIVHQPDRRQYPAIAQEMIASATDVIMGAGHPDYDHDGQPRRDRDYQYVGGRETWQALRNGTAGGDADGDGQPDPFTLLTSREDFRKLLVGEPPRRVLGIARVAETLQLRRAQPGRLGPFEEPLLASVPSLAEMSLGALNVLQQDPDGFVVMIEGGAVDWASHDNNGGRMIEEMVDFEDAVAVVVEWVAAHGGWDDTLLIVTADHETGSLTGLASAGLFAPMEFRGRGRRPGMSWHSRQHSNALVPLSAIGAGSELLTRSATGDDPRRGKYLDNTAIAEVGFAILR